MTYNEQAVADGFIAMCNDHRRYQKMQEETEKTEPVSPVEKWRDKSELDSFSIKFVQEQREIEVIIKAKDPLDCVTVAGFVVTAFKSLRCFPEVKVLP
jgi:hypothetical protein